MVELKSCPFCGNKNPQIVVDNETETKFGVSCFKCEAQISATFEERDEAEAAWNRRALPEPLTDKEQRIFLAAMGREEKVCEEVDRNYVREPYEDSLMRVCKEIRRKVKGALWT